VKLPHPLPHLLSLHNCDVALQREPTLSKIGERGRGFTPSFASGAKGQRFESSRAYQPLSRVPMSSDI